MKIAFYIENENIELVDCTNFEYGNPGIGGSEYAMFVLLDYFSKNKSDNQYVLLSNHIDKVSNQIESFAVKNIVDSFNVSKIQGVDIVIFKHNEKYIDQNIFLNFEKHYELKIIIWAHNFIFRKYLNFYSRHDFISRIVNVSNDQLNLYRDHNCFKKSVSIYNGIYTDFFSNDNNFTEREDEVTYVGSIIPSKGFHLIAKAWKEILRRIPTAKLNVIGTGQLYNRNEKLGEYGIAEMSYEKSFMPYITDENCQVLDSISFMGVLGVEKNEILKRSKVGVPNPSGLTETFGYTAVEMQGFGMLVTTKDNIGYRETVFKKKYLYKNELQLGDYVCNLLRHKNYQEESALDFIKKEFSINNIAIKWNELFFNIENNIMPEIFDIKNKDRMFLLIDINRKIKSYIPFGFKILPSLLFYNELLNKIKNTIRN